MRRAEKVVITCAVTGSLHTPTMSPHLPITPDQIATQAVEAAEAGAAVLHLHARDPVDGRPVWDPEIFMQFLPRIKQGTDAVVNITTGGGPGMTMDQRLAAALQTRPELASLNMGSINFGAFGLAERRTDWKYDWEKPLLESTRRNPQINSFEQIEGAIRVLHHDLGTRFEFECYDVGHLYTLKWFADQGLLKPPYFIQCVVGVLGGIGPGYDNFMYMVQVADKLFGDDYYLSCLPIGRDQMRYLTMSAILGGSVRVGLEDNLYLDRGRLAVTNAEQVAKIRAILEGLGFEIAKPDDVREMLSLRGGDTVVF